MPCLYVLNKIDSITIEELDLIDQVLLDWLFDRSCDVCINAFQLPHNVPISAKDEWNFDELLEHIWLYAKMIRM